MGAAAPALAAQQERLRRHLLLGTLLRAEQQEGTGPKEPDLAAEAGGKQQPQPGQGLECGRATAQGPNPHPPTLFQRQHAAVLRRRHPTAMLLAGLTPGVGPPTPRPRRGLTSRWHRPLPWLPPPAPQAQQDEQGQAREQEGGEAGLCEALQLSPCSPRSVARGGGSGPLQAASQHRRRGFDRELERGLDALVTAIVETAAEPASRGSAVGSSAAAAEGTVGPQQAAVPQQGVRRLARALREMSKFKPGFFDGKEEASLAVLSREAKRIGMQLAAQLAPPGHPPHPHRQWVHAPGESPEELLLRGLQLAIRARGQEQDAGTALRDVLKEDGGVRAVFSRALNDPEGLYQPLYEYAAELATPVEVMEMDPEPDCAAAWQMLSCATDGPRGLWHLIGGLAVLGQLLVSSVPHGWSIGLKPWPCAATAVAWCFAQSDATPGRCACPKMLYNVFCQGPAGLAAQLAGSPEDCYTLEHVQATARLFLTSPEQLQAWSMLLVWLPLACAGVDALHSAHLDLLAAHVYTQWRQPRAPGPQQQATDPAGTVPDLAAGAGSAAGAGGVGAGVAGPAARAPAASGTGTAVGAGGGGGGGADVGPSGLESVAGLVGQYNLLHAAICGGADGGGGTGDAGAGGAGEAGGGGSWPAADTLGVLVDALGCAVHLPLVPPTFGTLPAAAAARPAAARQRTLPRLLEVGPEQAPEAALDAAADEEGSGRCVRLELEGPAHTLLMLLCLGHGPPHFALQPLEGPSPGCESRAAQGASCPPPREAAARGAVQITITRTTTPARTDPRIPWTIMEAKSLHMIIVTADSKLPALLQALRKELLVQRRGAMWIKGEGVKGVHSLLQLIAQVRQVMLAAGRDVCAFTVDIRERDAAGAGGTTGSAADASATTEAAAARKAARDGVLDLVWHAGRLACVYGADPGRGSSFWDVMRRQAVLAMQGLLAPPRHGAPPVFERPLIELLLVECAPHQPWAFLQSPVSSAQSQREASLALEKAMFQQQEGAGKGKGKAPAFGRAA